MSQQTVEKTTEKITIKYKVFREENVKRICKTLYEAAEQMKSAETQASFRVIFEREDGQHETDNPDPFRLRDTHGSGTFRSFIAHVFIEPAYSIHFQIVHGSESGSQIIVSAPDKDWVSARTNDLQAALRDTQPQGVWFFPVRYPVVSTHVLAFALGVGIFELTQPLLSILGLELLQAELWRALDNLDARFVWSSSLILAFAMWLFGLPLALPIRSGVQKLYPVVEIDIGPEFRKLAKRGRKFVAGILTLIVIPLLINGIFNVLF